MTWPWRSQEETHDEEFHGTFETGEPSPGHGIHDVIAEEEQEDTDRRHTSRRPIPRLGQLREETGEELEMEEEKEKTNSDETEGLVRRRKTLDAGHGTELTGHHVDRCSRRET